MTPKWRLTLRYTCIISAMTLVMYILFMRYYQTSVRGRNKEDELYLIVEQVKRTVKTFPKGHLAYHANGQVIRS